jgi:two-component system CheB/CheR fusion protein
MAVEQVESSGHLAAIIASSDDAIISKNLDGIILSWNGAAQRMFGYTAEEATGKHITLIIPKDRTAEEEFVIGRIRAGLSVDHYETIRQRKDGSLIEISLSVSPIHNAAGVIVGASKIARDITEQNRQRRIAEHASRAKDEFLATLSHELRTPLNTVLGYVQMLKNHSVPADQQPKTFEVIERNARALGRLVDDVLDTSRIVSGKMRVELRPCALAPILHEAVASIAPAAERKRLDLRTQVEEGLTVDADADRLRQILWNLLSNAVKFTPQGGRIVVAAHRDDAYVSVVVEDSGAGIAERDIPLIFQRFWQGDNSGARVHGGLGLGLALTRHLVELHGATIAVRSPGIGLGSTFEIQFPVSHTAESTSSTP